MCWTKNKPTPTHTHNQWVYVCKASCPPVDTPSWINEQRCLIAWFELNWSKHNSLLHLLHTFTNMEVSMRNHKQLHSCMCKHTCIHMNGKLQLHRPLEMNDVKSPYETRPSIVNEPTRTLYIVKPTKVHLRPSSHDLEIEIALRPFFPLIE